MKFFDGAQFISVSSPSARGWGGVWFNWIGDIDGDGVDEIVSANNTKVYVKNVVPSPSGSELFPRVD